MDVPYLQNNVQSGYAKIYNVEFNNLGNDEMAAFHIFDLLAYSLPTNFSIIYGITMYNCSSVCMLL